jgi:hypothetical protein
MTDDEKRGYSKGYAAGRRAMRRSARDLRDAAREDFVQRMMIAIAPQIIASPWERTVKGEKRTDQTAPEIMKTVRFIAIEAAEMCKFPVAYDDSKEQPA